MTLQIQDGSCLQIKAVNTILNIWWLLVVAAAVHLLATELVVVAAADI